VRSHRIETRSFTARVYLSDRASHLRGCWADLWDITRVVALALRDAKQVQNLKAGATVDVTYFESLLIKVARPPR
jgi:hypothetical protein